MECLFEVAEVPNHLLDIPGLDFSEELFAERVASPWFRLGAWTSGDAHPGAAVVDRQSLLIDPAAFTLMFKQLDAIGNVVAGLGTPGVTHGGDQSTYRYEPFHRFHFRSSDVTGEPMVFLRSTASGVVLVINPDLWLSLDLEEQHPGSGLWWDPLTGQDALVNRHIEAEAVQVVEIRTEYLLRYLRRRQSALLVGHYAHHYLLDPGAEALAAFVPGSCTLGSPERGVKALFENSHARAGFSSGASLLRRLHLWFAVDPPPIGSNDPWADEPDVDLSQFTLPTLAGPVAPARFRKSLAVPGKPFAGETCDFMSRIFFRQEVLSKYEGAAGFAIADDGSLRCRTYWGLDRSTARIGNELLSTAIGDFAEGVPVREWPHWQQFAVDPPSTAALTSLNAERPLPVAVNDLFTSLSSLNAAGDALARELGIVDRSELWTGSLDSLAGRQLKWVYPADADDEEFVKRVTLVSTLVLEGLDASFLRRVLRVFGSGLHMSNGQPLGSRRLLLRLLLVTRIARDVGPPRDRVERLVALAEGAVGEPDEAELRVELQQIGEDAERTMEPLALLYELRNAGGIAHTPDKLRIAAASAQLGLPERAWHRSHYLTLLGLVSASVSSASADLAAAATAMWTEPPLSTR